MSLLFILFGLLSISIQFCNADLDTEWQNFKIKYNKFYQNSKEETLRKTIFENSLKYIRNHNVKQRSGLTSYEIETNVFSDLTDDEFKAMFLNSQMENDNNLFLMNITESPNVYTNNTPESKNWIENGYRNPVLHQGSCGSCYTFGAIAAIEAHYFIKNKKLIQLSHQEVLDCSKPLGNNGCKGGLTQRTYEYAVKNGIGYAINNPYLGKEDICRRIQPRFQINGFYKIEYGNETALKEIVGNIGPVAFGFDAGKPSFRYYKTGIYYEPECNNTILSHAMVVVGYGNEDNQDYWLVRNSWGTEWGENGHIKVVRNKDNHCGIASRALYPV